jgi:hypothetical protein
MLSRALILATVALLIGGFAAAPTPVQAQNLEAGKSPSQIFAGTCTACHKSARGLLRTVSPGALPGFLRQHYTTSPEMAGLLSSFLISNGAADTRRGAGQRKADKAGRAIGSPSEQPDRPGRRLRGAASQEGAEPEQATNPEGTAPVRGRRAKRLARPADEAARPVEGEVTAPAVKERGAQGRKSIGRRLSRRGKPAVEAPSKESSKEGDTKGGSARDAPLREEKPAAEAAKSEGSKPSADGAPDAARSDNAKSDTAKSDAPKSEPIKPEAPKEAGNGRNPVPAVTSAPATPPGAAASSAPAASQPAPPAVADSAPAPVAPAPPAPSTPK